MSHNEDDEHRKSNPDEDEFSLIDLLPQYFALCRRDLEHMRKALLDGKLDDIRIVGHNLKGSGGAYGFPELSQMGLAIEAAAKTDDQQSIERQIEELADFLEARQPRG